MQTLLLPSDLKSGICHRMAPLRMLYVTILTYSFKVTNSEIGTSRKWWELPNNAQGTTFILSSNCIIAKVVLHDHDLNFQSLKFETLISRHPWDLSQKYVFWLCRSWYSQSNGTIVNVVLRDLDLHFQGQTFSCYAFAKNAQAAAVPADLPRLARPMPCSCSCFFNCRAIWSLTYIDITDCHKIVSSHMTVSMVKWPILQVIYWMCSHIAMDSTLLISPEISNWITRRSSEP